MTIFSISKMNIFDIYEHSHEFNVILHMNNFLIKQTDKTDRRIDILIDR